jgi:hypothetical protein
MPQAVLTRIIGTDMTSTFCILGWGSLIWNPDILKVDGDWELDGPTLPIEFSRISKNGRLTQVIDEQHGAPVSVRYCKSGCATLAEAIENLRVREDAPTDRNMGFVDVRTGETSAAAAKYQPRAVEAIRDWVRRKNCDGVIWTALGPKFLSDTSFSPERARRYLESLKGEVRSSAIEYMRSAPSEVVTPTRTLCADLLNQ